jgi:hypothetical protein
VKDILTPQKRKFRLYRQFWIKMLGYGNYSVLPSEELRVKLYIRGNEFVYNLSEELSRGSIWK